MKFKINTKGQSLIEILVALGIITIIATALTSVVITSLGNARSSKDQALATQYATEGLEIMRLKRDIDYTAFQNIISGTYCLDKGASNLGPNCTSSNVDNFIRKVTIAQSGCAVKIARISVIVSWQDSKCPASNSYCHNSKLETCLSTVNPVQAL